VQQKASCGEALIALLSDYGFEVVFGIPGTHAVELYRGLGNLTMQFRFKKVTGEYPILNTK
jgi:thiamine pyrophosphate-dependent acetolactate synthase large subunit-like protein